MLKFHARELAGMSDEQLWALDEGMPPQSPMQVIFDDGVLDTTIRKTIYSAYMWGMYKTYSKAPALMHHHIGDMRMGMDVHLTLLNRVMWDAYDAYGGTLDVEEMCRQVYQSINRLYNVMTYNLEEYITTLSILDFVEVTEHPEIKEIIANTEPTSFSIENYCYPAARKVLLSDPSLKHNGIAINVRSELVSMGQVLQTCVMRGAVADIDENIFKNPVMANFTGGLNLFHDSLIESRSAAKALSFTQEPLQEVEYFNRKMQLMAGVIQRLHPGDCGSQHFLRWHVHSGDLQNIAGHYYLTEEGKLKPIRRNDKHLIGKTLQLRSTLLCVHPDPQGICATCMGELALSVPRGTNPGHFSATALGEQAAQRVLSTKHHDANSSATGKELSSYEQRFLRTEDDPNILKLSEQVKGLKVNLIISAKESTQLSDVTYVENVNDLQTGQITSLTEVRFSVIGADGVEEDSTIAVNVGSRHASLTHEALAYIKEKSWSLNALGNVVIDLSDWNNAWPLMELPLRHTNMLDSMKSIERFFRASTSTTETTTGPTLRDYKTMEEGVLALYQLVTSMLTVNLSHLEILMKSVMIRSEKHRDYRIPRVGNVYEVGAFDTTMENRSLSATMAFEKHRQVLTNVGTYLNKHRPDHPLDALMEG